MKELGCGCISSPVLLWCPWTTSLPVHLLETVAGQALNHVLFQAFRLVIHHVVYMICFDDSSRLGLQVQAPPRAACQRAKTLSLTVRLQRRRTPSSKRWTRGPESQLCPIFSLRTNSYCLRTHFVWFAIKSAWCFCTVRRDTASGMPFGCLFQRCR